MVVRRDELRIAARLEEIATACKFVYDAAQRAGLDEKALHHCQLVIDEACTNIIEHGYSGGDQPDQIIDIICISAPEIFSIELIDNGPAFDPFDQLPPDPGDDLNSRRPGGWGVYFIKKLMDKVFYERRDNQNHLVMAKYLTVSQADRAPERSNNRVIVKHIPHGLTVITLAGRVDSAISSELESLFRQQAENGNHQIILDLTDVEHISSSGLKLLVSTWRRVREANGNLVMAGVQPALYEVLKLLGFDLVFTIFDTVDQAISDFPA